MAYSEQQQKVVPFIPDAPTAHGQWVILRTFHWRPPDYPIPETRRRMLRHNALEGGADDAEDGLATLSTAGALMNLSDDCWTATTSFANVVEVAINR